MKKRTVPDISSEQVLYLIDQWIHNERNRKLMKRRYIDGIGFEALSEEFDLSVRQTKNIAYEGLEKILKKIE